MSIVQPKQPVSPGLYKENDNLNFNKIPLVKTIFKNYFQTHNVFPLNKRVKIDTGKFCNASCNFCYYLPHVNSKTHLKVEDLQNFIPKLLANGVREFEFSGGEPTLTPNLPEIVDTIVALALKNDVYEDEISFSIVTNGIRINEVLKEIPRINEVLVSIHGINEDHDQIVNQKGAYKKIRQFLDTFNPEETLVRVNVVISKDNTQNLIKPEFIDLLRYFLDTGIQVNLLPMNFWSQASLTQPITKEQEQEIYDTIDTISEELFSTIITNEISNVPSPFKKELRSNIFNIRYAQKCKLNEAAQAFVRGHIDHYFDQHDWNKIWYPDDSNPDILNNYSNLDTEEITPKAIIKSYTHEASTSHYKDKICARCPELSCDGRKYIDQKNHLLFEEYPYEIRTRKMYAGIRV